MHLDLYTFILLLIPMSSSFSLLCKRIKIMFKEIDFFSIHNESLIAPFILTSMYIINNSCISFPPHSLTRLLLLFLVPFFSVYFFIFCIPSWILNDYDENRMRQKMNFPFHVPPPYSISLTIMRLIFHHLFTCSSFLVYMYTHMHIYTWT